MKQDIRKEMIEKREIHHSAGGHVNCIEIMDRILYLPEFLSAKCVLLYSSKGGEVHTDGIIRSALAAGKKVALPVTGKEKHMLHIYEIKEIDELVLGAFGILEPSVREGREVLPEEVDLALIPGVSFDRRGHRIGYGMGYYDSLLKKIRGRKVGLCYSFQIVEKVPEESHDVPMDALVTEKEVMVCKGAEAGGVSKKKFRVAVLASGRGSDFQSLIEAKKRGEIDVEFVGLITDNPQAKAIERASEAGVPAFVIAHNSREELDDGVLAKLDEITPELVVLAGYMKVIKSAALLSRYRGRIINIHPSLLPKYPGAHAQKDAFDAGEKISGYTIHYVDESLDGGKIIHRENVDISGCKSADDVSAKILAQEHIGLPLIVGKFARGELP